MKSTTFKHKHGFEVKCAKPRENAVIEAKSISNV
jgi:hypothetical protein